MFNSLQRLVLTGVTSCMAGMALGQAAPEDQWLPRGPYTEYRVVKPPSKADGEYRLGIAVSATSPALAAQLRLPAGTGAVVEQVMPGTAAQKAGLQQYDVVVKVDGRTIKNPRQLAEIVASHDSDDDLEFAIIREGRPRTLHVRVGHQDVKPPQPKYKKMDGKGFYFGENGKQPFTLRLQKGANGDEMIIVRTPDGKTFKQEVLPDLDKLRDQLKRDLEQLERLKKQMKSLQAPKDSSPDDSNE